MGQTGHGQIGRKFRGEKLNSVDETGSKGSIIKNDLVEYVPKTFLKISNKKIKMLILLLTVSRIFLWLSQRH